MHNLTSILSLEREEEKIRTADTVPPAKAGLGGDSFQV